MSHAGWAYFFAGARPRIVHINFFTTNKHSKLFVLLIVKQEVQGLQAFAFPVVTVNNEHAKSSLKRSLRG